MKCMRLNTLGSAGARSTSASTVQPLIGWRAFFRIQTTSNAVHAAVPASTSSIGRGPTFRPPASGEPSTTTAWPLPVSATKLTWSIHLTVAFNRDLPSNPKIRLPPAVMDNAGREPLCRLHCAVQYDKLLLSAIRDLLLPVRRSFLHSPPMAEYLARSTSRAFFIALARSAGGAWEACTARAVG